MKHTIAALVRNRIGVVADVADVFRQHGVNFKSISCAETEAFDVSRLVVTVEDQTQAVNKALDSLHQCEDVVELDDLSRQDYVDREMALIKVNYTHDTMAQVMQILEVFRANVVGMGEKTVSVEITGDEDKVDGLIKMLRPHGIHNLCRTGVIALKRGDE